MIFLIFSLIFSPFARASWDLWAQAILHLAAVIYLLVMCLRIFFAGRLTLPPKKLLIAGALLLIWNALSTLTSAYPYQAILETLNLANGLLIFFVVSQETLPWKKGRILLGAAAFYLVVTSISQYNPFRIAASFPMVNPNILAGYLAACSIGVIDGAFDNSSSRRERILFGICLAFCIFGIFLARSLGGFLAALVGAAFWFWKRYPKARLFLLLGGCLVATAVCLFKLSAVGGRNRILWWNTALRMVKAHPFVGVGPGGYEHAHLYFRPAKGLNTVYPHSEPLRAASETGLVGFILWAGLLALIFHTGLKRDSPGALAGAIALLFHNLYDYSLSIFACQILFWALAGWTLHEERPSRKFHILNPQAAKACFVLGWLFCLGTAMWITKIFLANRHTARGEIELSEGHPEHARGHFEAAIRLWPLNPSDSIGLARVHLGPPEEPLEIKRFLEEARALDRYGLSIRAKSEE